MKRMPLRSLFLALLTMMALCSCAGQSSQEDNRILITGINTARNQITFTFKRTGQVRVYYVDGLTEIANKDGYTLLRDIDTGEQVYAYHVRYGSRTLDSLIIGYSDPNEAD